MKRAVSTWIAVLALGCACVAQDDAFPEPGAGEITIAVAPTRADTTLGAKVAVKVHVRVAKGFELSGLSEGNASKRLFGTWTASKDAIGIEVDLGESRTETDDSGALHFYAEPTVRALRLGSIELPSLVARAKPVSTDSGASGGPVTAESAVLTLEVGTVLEEGGSRTAAEVSDEFVVDAPSPPLWPWIVGAFGALALGILFRFWMRRRRRDLPAVVAPRIPPDQQAFARIRELERMLERGEIGGERLVVEASATLRKWLEDGLGQASLARTTDEFLDDLRRTTRFSVVQQNRLQDFLRRCDLIKFAGQEPTQVECKDLLGSVRAFVEETAQRHAEPIENRVAKVPVLVLPAVVQASDIVSGPSRTFAEWQESVFGFAFADPWFLLLLLVLPLLVWRARGRKPALGIASASLIDGMPRTVRSQLRWLPRTLVILALVPLILACARPQVLERVPIESQGIDIMLTLDLSSSMAARDLGDASPPGQGPTRLDVVKRVAKQFIEKRTGDRIGLIAFARYPDLVCPRTLDHQALLRFLEPLQHKRVPTAFGDRGDPEDGTAIGAALALTAERLRDEKVKSRVAILLSDGNETVNSIDPIEAAKLASDADVRIYAIGAGRYQRDPFGRLSDKIDFTTLRQIADKTGGEFFEANSETALDEIFDRIDQLERTELEDPVFAVDERFQVLLLAGFSMLVLAGLLRFLVFVEVP
ncbi:MAG: VWA domain-containing protein [Planctomycetes bacterium]|nr:VWA domain-containing protein [Planctomycetota bacterium]